MRLPTFQATITGGWYSISGVQVHHHCPYIHILSYSMCKRLQFLTIDAIEILHYFAGEFERAR
jgi:hypothetical protein